ncbi:hypothetical protein ALC62_04227 [Cyphomyrmex costatus]|uniref:Uncharacterized protein n=1 Tax=Cyphomyrmex costatus TaxID=456900 RepID=A0A195CVY3_9HYME|nr:hypothetical protein ALC62_04227 [Cyphomyrmex costatus]
MSRCRVKHSKPHCRLRLLNFSPCRCDKLKFNCSVSGGSSRYADQVDQHDTTNDCQDYRSIQAQTARNASQKIHQVTDDREMTLDQSTAEIRKCLNGETTRRRRGKFAAASRPVARVVGEIVGYRLYASLRCQRTQARSCPLSSSRAKATAAGGSGDGGGCSSSVSAVYGPVYRGKIRRKGEMVVGGGTQPSSETEGDQR